MGSVIALLAWLMTLLLGFYVWRKALVVFSSLLALILSPFWQSIAVSRWVGEETTIARPAVAFVSIWVLVLLPIVRRRLDAGIVLASLSHGLVALAAIGMSIDITDMAFAILETEAVSKATPLVLGLCILIGLFFSGFVLCCFGDDFPWDYAPWFAGLMLMVQSRHPLMRHLDLSRDQGVSLLIIAFILSFLLYQGWRYQSRIQFVWVSCVLLTPVVIGAIACQG